MASRMLWRIVRTNPPTEDDFLSSEARGRRLRRSTAEAIRLWGGLSMFASQTRARDVARAVPTIGSFLAEVEIEGMPVVRVEKTLGEGHYTVWGIAADLLRQVTRVTPV